MAELTCQELVELVTDYLEGTLGWRDRRRFDEHLALRPCDGYLEQMRETLDLLGAMPVDTISAEAQADPARRLPQPGSAEPRSRLFSSDLSSSSWSTHARRGVHQPARRRVIALIAPLTLGFAPRLRFPAVVLEIVAGVVVGPSVLGWVEVDLPVSIVAVLGLAFLLFLAGLEIDVRQLRGRCCGWRCSATP